MSRTAYADQLAATLRDRRSFHVPGVRCDALDPCADCAAGRAEVVTARVPAQRARSA